jgi:UDP-N-acetylglucosamine--N-acetylmuramyl-(pentapeptide) pyrophosphoryl-undecaprenol N-acetylglucosamine transferase
MGAMRVVIAGGGTAGHVHPGLALARELRDRGADVSFLGTETGLEARLVPAAGFRFDVLRALPLARRFSLRAARAPFVALDAVRACRPLIREADAVVGMGGYVSVPAVLAARRERIPAVLHEQNAVAGLANRTLARARAARAVALSFADARSGFPRSTRTVITGNPVREEIVRVPEERDALAKEARGELDLDEHRRTIVLFGGSQGALHLDRAAIGTCQLLGDRSDLQIVLITGPAHLEVIRRGMASSGPGSIPDRSGGVLAVAGEGGGLVVRLVGYLERMELAYASADLMVARAGATTVAEISACGLPALLVPYPYATARHQQANARAMQRAGAASTMLDEEVSAQTLAERIVSLIDHDERLRAMRERSEAFGRPDAAQRLADVVADVSGGPEGA